MVDPARLQQLDSAEVCVLVDNTLDILSSVPDCVVSEIPNIRKAGATELTGSCLCCAARGLSLVITTHVGKRGTHEQCIEPTVGDLRRFGLQRIVPGHCTGWRAVPTLVREFGDAVVPSAVGQLHRFSDAAT